MEQATNNLNIYPTPKDGETVEIVYRTGKALELRDPKAQNLAGVLGTPYNWLAQRTGLIDPKASRVVVDRDRMSITLVVDERSVFSDTITGSLTFDQNFLKFRINTDEYITHYDMAKFFKMNRYAFENKDEAGRLVTELQNFKAKVNAEVEKMNDNRGNRTDKTQVTIDSNLPEKFNLNLPVFKGGPKKLIEVEVYINSDFCCTLISPDVVDFVEEVKNELIDFELGLIRELVPGLVILEV